MITRRSFLSAAAALAGRPALTSQRAGSASSPVSPPVPASIAALTSMRGQARPITSDERRARIDHARRLMTVEKIDALILSGGTSLLYFTNIRWGGGERLFACVIPATSRPEHLVDNMQAGVGALPDGATREKMTAAIAR